MDYIELKIFTGPDFAEILVAELAEVGFESFTDFEDGINAYIRRDIFDKTNIDEIINRYAGQTALNYEISDLEKKNWNDEWEKNYNPVRIEDICLIRASFHPSENFPYEIIINPKMSFGTGHHETTCLMILNQLKVSHVNKSVLDVGSGTGILAIMASKLGASYVEAFDIEDWAVENAKENFELNHARGKVSLGTISSLQFDRNFDIVLANINRNILLSEINLYAGLLNENGFLIVSGFYDNDSIEIENCAGLSGLYEIEKSIKNNWSSIIFQKKGTTI